MPEAAAGDGRETAWHDALAEENAGRQVVVLASSRRLCRTLLTEHNERMVARGSGAWSTPPIYFWQDWLARLFDETDPESRPRVLPPAAINACWEEAIRPFLPDNLAGAAGLAKQAASASRLLGEWNLGPAEVRKSARSADEVEIGRAHV